MNTSLTLKSLENQHAVQRAVQNGIKDYFAENKTLIQPFIKKHFHYPGCWRTNKVAFGVDLLRAPINLMWAPLYLLLLCILFLAKWAGARWAGAVMEKLPAGITTKVQRNINALIQAELLDIERLHGHIDNHLLPLAQQLIGPDLDKDALRRQLDHIVDDALKQLMQSRTAAADISNTVFTAMVGALVFKKFTPGGIGVGLIGAALYVKLRAQQTFFLGSTIGGLYYSVFPPAATTQENLIAIFIVMLFLSIVATFSGLITDPLQAIFGVHRRRLTKMMGKLESSLLDNKNNKFKTLDPYLARILDLFDTVKSHVGF